MARARRLAGLGCLVLGIGCSQDSGVASVLVVSMVEVTPPTGAVVIGETLQLTAVPKTEGGIPLPARGVVWSSTDINTATVTPEGAVRGLSVGGPVRIRATVEGVSGETQITVVPVPVDHVIVTPPTSSIVAGQQAPLTATAYDASNTALTGRTFAWSSAAPGIADVTSSGLVLGIAPGGPVQITAAVGGKTGSASVTVAPRTATRLGFVGQPPAATMAGQALTPPIRVAVQDDLLGTVTSATNSVTIALANNPGAATLAGTRTVAAVNGIATFSNLSLNRLGTGYTLVATSTTLTSAISNSFNVIPGAANRLALTTTPPATARSGIGLTANPVVQVRDANGNAVPGAAVPITVSASGAATVGGATTVVTNAGGAATFTGLTITAPIGSYTLTFTAPGLTPITSSAMAITAGNAASIGITTHPAATARSGIVLAPQPAVRLFDATGNPVSQSGVSITVAVQSGPSGGNVSGNTAINTNATGAATYANLALNGLSGSYTLRFSSPGLTQAISNPVVLSPGTGSVLLLTTQPSATAASGQAFGQQPVVRLFDAASNPVLQAGVVVTASVLSGGGTPGGATTAVTNSSGIATFATLSISGTIGERLLRFTATGYAAATSNPISLTAGAPVKLAIVTQPPASAQSGLALSVQPVLQIQDASGNAVSLANVVVTASIQSGGGTLGGITTAASNAVGVAAFTNLVLNGTPGARTLRFAATGYTSAVSGTITLGAGAASRLIMATQPSASAQSGVALAVQPAVQLVDAQGTAVSQAGVLVTVGISQGNGTLGGTTTATTSTSGRAQFSGLVVTGKTGSYLLSFSSSGLTGVVSGSINLTAGAPALLVIAVQPSAAAQYGVVFPVQPTVQVQDVSGNVVSGVVVSAAVSSGAGTLGGTPTATSNALGNAVFSGLSISGKLEPYVLAFSAGALPPVASGPVVLSAGPPTQLIVATQPSPVVNSGIPFPVQPVIQLADAGGNPAPVAGASVVASVNACSFFGASLGGTTSILTDASGRASYSGLTLNLVFFGSTCTLKFTAGSLSINSASITVNP